MSATMRIEITINSVVHDLSSQFKQVMIGSAIPIEGGKLYSTPKVG